MEWGPISIGVTVALSIATTILIRRLTRRKKPTWAYTTKKLIGLGTDAPKGLQLTFNSKPVNDIYQTTFIFFNRGRETIRNGDVTQPVTMHFHEGEILRKPVIKATSNEAIKFSAKHVIAQGGHQVRLEFLYLDHEDGGACEILHTKSSEITCAANIIGAKEIDNAGKLIVSSQTLSRLKILRPVCWAMISASVPSIIYGQPAFKLGGTVVMSRLFLASFGVASLVIGTIILAGYQAFRKQYLPTGYLSKLPSWYETYLEKAE